MSDKKCKTCGSDAEWVLDGRFGYDAVWHLVGLFDKYGFVSYEEYWSGDEKSIEATVAVWKREGALKIIQSKYLKSDLEDEVTFDWEEQE